MLLRLELHSLQQLCILLRAFPFWTSCFLFARLSLPRTDVHHIVAKHRSDMSDNDVLSFASVLGTVCASSRRHRRYYFLNPRTYVSYPVHPWLDKLLSPFFRQVPHRWKPKFFPRQSYRVSCLSQYGRNVLIFLRRGIVTNDYLVTLIQRRFIIRADIILLLSFRKVIVISNTLKTVYTLGIRAGQTVLNPINRIAILFPILNCFSFYPKLTISCSIQLIHSCLYFRRHLLSYVWRIAS